MVVSHNLRLDLKIDAISYIDNEFLLRSRIQISTFISVRYVFRRRKVFNCQNVNNLQISLPLVKKVKQPVLS